MANPVFSNTPSFKPGAPVGFDEPKRGSVDVSPFGGPAFGEAGSARMTVSSDHIDGVEQFSTQITARLKEIIFILRLQCPFSVSLHFLSASQQLYYTLEDCGA